jgi:hypothetical protein
VKFPPEHALTAMYTARSSICRWDRCGCGYDDNCVSLGVQGERRPVKTSAIKSMTGKQDVLPGE